MKNITLYSNDSSYGGISFIANHIDSNVILRSSVRKDFDKMINDIIFLSNKRSADILKKTDHLIVFGCISMKIMLKTLSNLKIPVNRFKKLTLIISDNEFLRQNEFWNQFLLKNLFVDILIMPDLISSLDKRLSYRPYFQHIPVPQDLVIDRGLGLKITHSPGLKYASGIKGTPFIKSELKGFDLDIIHGVEWSDSLSRKASSHIFVDQMRVESKAILKDGPGHKGGLGKSGLEAMLLGCLTITSGSKLVTEPFFENPPAIFISPEKLRETVEFYSNNKKKMKEHAKIQQAWAEKYLSKSFVINNILK